MIVRVLRILAYEYPDEATALADQARWSVPANGVHVVPTKPGGRTPRLTIRSATCPPELIEDRS